MKYYFVRRMYSVFRTYFRTDMYGLLRTPCLPCILVRSHNHARIPHTQHATRLCSPYIVQMRKALTDRRSRPLPCPSRRGMAPASPCPLLFLLCFPHRFLPFSQSPIALTTIGFVPVHLSPFRCLSGPYLPCTTYLGCLSLCLCKIRGRILSSKRHVTCEYLS